VPPPSPRRRAYQRGPHLFTRRVRSGALVWYARTKEKPKGVSLGTSDHDAAVRKFAALVAGGAASVAQELGRPVELALLDVVAAWLDAPHGYTARTHRSAKNRLRAFGKWCAAKGAVLPSEVTAEVLDAWITARGAVVARRTINRDLRVLRTMWRWAAGRGLCAAGAPAATRADLREPKREGRHVVPDAAEMRKILRALDAQHAGAAAAVRALYVTGLRIEELRRLTAFDVRDGAVHVRPEAGPAATAAPTKGYQERRIPLAARALAVVRAFLAWRAGGPRRACAEGWLLRRLARACKTAGVPRCGLHDLRRAFATEAVGAGVSVRVVSGWLGHAAVATTERYLAAYRSDDDVRAPVPAGLGRAESVRKAGATSGGVQGSVQVGGGDRRDGKT
jgi:integrase